MSRELSSWAQSRRERTAPRITLPADVGRALRAWFRRQRPGGVPPRPAATHLPGSRARLADTNLRRLLLPRLDVELVGADALTGLEQPLVFAANEQGSLDYRILRQVLPPQLRPTMTRPSRALARGRNVAVFTDDPLPGRLVGKFTTVPAELANQHNVVIVPVGLVGTFGLKNNLKLALRTRPKVSIRFGAPIYLRGRTIAGATEELQSRVEQLVHEGELTWWTVEQRRSGGPAPVQERTARWQRLWDQAAPKPAGKPRIWR